MTKTKRLSSLLMTISCLGLVLFCLLAATVKSSAQQVPNIQGRWEFAVTSGDTTDQLNSMGQSTISTYLMQNGTSLTNIVSFTTDTIACDVLDGNNVTVSNSTIDAQGNVTVAFTITNPDQTSFQYVFTGVFAQGGPGVPTVITGTYQRSAGGCTQGSLGTGQPDGNFTATYFPDMDGIWAGAFDGPAVGSGPTSVPATFTLSTNADKTLGGTVTAPGLTNESGTACLAGPVTLQPLAEGVSYAAGVNMQLYGADSNGTHFWVLGSATNPDGSAAAVGEDDPADGSYGTINDGTNNDYTAYYGISGGPCDGMGGGDAPFRLVTKPKKNPNKDPRNNPVCRGNKGFPCWQQTALDR